MQKPERSTYTPLDFLNWREQNGLVLVPKFQRGRVWTTPARSYLIDTMIRGMPIPPIYLRITQSPEKNRIIREVVDGQQRIHAVLDFIDEKYALSRNLAAPYAGRWFSELTEEQRDAIRQFSFIHLSSPPRHHPTRQRIHQMMLRVIPRPHSLHDLRGGTLQHPEKRFRV